MKNSRFVKFEKFEKFVRRVPFITLPFDYPRLIAGLFSNGYACIIDQNIRFLSTMKHFNSCRDVICHVFHGLPAIVRRFTWISKSNDSSAWTIIALFCNNSFILSWTGLHGEFVDRSNKLKNIAPRFVRGGSDRSFVVLLSVDGFDQRNAPRCSDFNP